MYRAVTMHQELVVEGGKMSTRPLVFTFFNGYISRSNAQCPMLSDKPT